MSQENRYKFILFIIVTSTIGQMSAEIYIPSLPYISHDFHASSSLTQLSIAVFLFGMALPGIFFGYVSDFFGRRKILLFATSISCVGSVLCLFAPNIYMLIVGRFIQGVGFSGVGSLSRAILRDRMSGVELAKYASNLAMILALVIDLSPFLGGLLQEHFGWRPIFLLLLSYNLLAVYLSYRYQDHSSAVLNDKLDLGRVFHTAIAMLQNPQFLRYNLIAALTYSVLMSYLAVASFLFERVIGITPSQFGTTTLGLSFVYMFGAFLNGRLLHYSYSMDKLIRNGIVLMYLSCLLLILFASFIPLSYWGLVSFVAVIYLASSALFSNSSAQAFSAMEKNIGSASAVYSSLQVLVGAIFTALISLFHPTSTLPLAIFIGLICLGLSLLYRWQPKR